MRESLRDFCMRTGNTHVLREWDKDKNGGITPDMISSGSSRKVWWRCEQGHSWQADVFSRTKGSSRCPYCLGKLAIHGKTDLASRYPEIAREWHPTLNGNLTPAMVTAGSRKKVWWICSEGHVWKAAIYSRGGKQKTGCPVCAGKVKLGARFPAIAAWAENPVNGN